MVCSDLTFSNWSSTEVWNWCSEFGFSLFFTLPGDKSTATFFLHIRASFRYTDWLCAQQYSSPENYCWQVFLWFWPTFPNLKDFLTYLNEIIPPPLFYPGTSLSKIKIKLTIYEYCSTVIKNIYLISGTSSSIDSIYLQPRNFRVIPFSLSKLLCFVPTMLLMWEDWARLELYQAL